MTEEEMRRAIAERNQAFENDDIDWARRNLPFMPSSPIIAEIAFHKARAACGVVSVGKRQASLKWLSDRNYSPMAGSFTFPKRPS